MKSLHLETKEFKDLTARDKAQCKQLSFKNGLMRGWISSKNVYLYATLGRNSKGNIVGWCLVRKMLDFPDHLFNCVDFCVFVSRSYRKRGIGTALVAEAKQSIRKINPTIRLKAWPHTLQGRKVFKQLEN